MNSINWIDKNLILKDGVRLSSRIWKPNGHGPWPALLMRQPYGREIASTITYAHPSWFAKHGFLVIVQDVRGQGNSTGNFNGFSQEASDTSESHRWVRSLPDCNGKLGTYGFSYQGITQLLAENNTSPPDCMAPAMTGLDECNHWSCEGGAFLWDLGILWGLQMAAMQLKRKGELSGWTKIKESIETGSYIFKGHYLLEKYDPEGMAINWLKKSNDYSYKWKVHQPQSSWLKSPMLLLGGWWDPHLKGILDIYQRSIKEGGSPDLYIGPATHLEWWKDIQNIHLEFFCRHLQGLSIQKAPKFKINLWNITKKEWEVPQINKTTNLFWGIDSQGLACIEQNEGQLKRESFGKGEITIVHDPWRPAPSIGGHTSSSPGLKDRKAIDKRTDVAKFTTKSFDQDLCLSGIPVFEIKASSDKDGFDLFIALSIIDNKESKATQISTGLIRVLDQDSKKDLIRKINLQPINADIKNNEKLRLSISAAAWPSIGINPGNSSVTCGPPSIDCSIITISMQLDQSKLYFLPFLSN